MSISESPPAAVLPVVGALGIALFIGTPARAQDDGPDAGVARVDEYLERLEAFGLAGNVLVAKDGDVLVARGYGLADRGDAGPGGARSGHAVGTGVPRPWTSGTVSSVGSITKQFTAAAIMKLVDQGRLSVHDSIARFFDDVPEDKRGITLHHLLTHTAGLGEADAGDFDFVSRAAIVRTALDSELISEPGTDYRYSNLGYSLLGAVVEVVTGADYERWLREHLFRPAGMYETGYLLPGYEPERIATGYERGERWGTVIERLDPATGPSWVLRANGGIHTTPYDMLRWVRALGMTGPSASDAEAILSAESRRRMFSPHADEGVGSWYGYGWVVDTTARGTRVIRHNGGNGILFADLHLFPDEGIVTFMMTGEAGLPATRLLDEVDDLLFGVEAEMPPAVEPVTVDPAALRALTGRYVLQGGGTVNVEFAGTALVLHVEGQPALDRIWTDRSTGDVPYEQLDRSARVFARAFGDGDFATMRRMLGPDAPEQPFRTTRARMLERLGPLGEIEVLGTLPAWFHSGSSEVTWLRLHFEKMTTIRRVHWSADGTVVGLGGQAYPAPLSLRCAMTGPSSCVGWQPGPDVGAPRVEFAGEGVPDTLVLRTGGTEIIGRRVD